MDFVNAILQEIIGFIDSVLPVFGLPNEFLIMLDSAFCIFVDLIQGAGYFLPLDVFMLCMTAMLLVDNFAILMRVGQWVIRTIRG